MPPSSGSARPPSSPPSATRSNASRHDRRSVLIGERVPWEFQGVSLKGHESAGARASVCHPPQAKQLVGELRRPASAPRVVPCGTPTRNRPRWMAKSSGGSIDTDSPSTPSATVDALSTRKVWVVTSSVGRRGSQWFAGRLRLAQRKPTERGDQDHERYDSGQEPRRRGSSAKYRHDQQAIPTSARTSQRRCVAPEERRARETATEPPIRPTHARRRYPRLPIRKTVRTTAPTTTQHHRDHSCGPAGR